MNKKDTAALLGCDERTVTNYATDGLLSTAYVKGKTRPVADYNETEVRALKLKIESGEIGKGIKKSGNRAVAAPVSGNHEEIVDESGNHVNDNQKSTKQETRKAGKGTELARIPNQENQIGKSGNNNFFVVSPGDMEALLNRAGQGNTLQELAVKPLLTFAEAAQLTGLSERSLRADAKANKLSATRIGKADRIYRSDLDSYLRTKTKK